MSTLNPLQFRNMNELTDFLNSLEQRMINLETENNALKDELSKVKSDEILRPVKTSEEPKSKTRLLSDNFITRAFTVWGHYFVANLIISIPIIICSLIIIALSWSSYGNYLPSIMR
jgi:hypothetical protein